MGEGSTPESLRELESALRGQIRKALVLCHDYPFYVFCSTTGYYCRELPIILMLSRRPPREPIARRALAESIDNVKTSRRES